MAGDFARDTAVSGSNGRYRAELSPAWEVWGPLGGYVAAVALRAAGAETALARPASFSCAFLSMARFGEVEISVDTLRRGRRSHALALRMEQEGRLILAGQAWAVDSGMKGFEHDFAQAPDVPAADRLRSFSELADDYDQWYPLWQTVEGKPVEWRQGPSDPTWHCWMRLNETPALHADPWLDAARTAMWMDLMMWNGAIPPHFSADGPRPLEYLAPNLDLACTFHAAAPEPEWLLCEAHAPVAAEGIVGCQGRVWTPTGALTATGTSTLFCRPNPLADTAAGG